MNYRSMIIGLVIFSSILAFLFTGFGRIGLFNFKGMDPTTALIVGKQTVSMNEFSNILTTQGYSNAMPDNQKKYLTSQVLQDLIYQKLLIEEAQKIGFGASQDDIAVFIRSLKVFQDANTQQFSLERLKQYIASQQINEIEFYENVRNELTIRNLMDVMTLNGMYPSAIANTQYIIENTEFYLKYAILNIHPTHLNEKSLAQVDEFLNDSKNIEELQKLYNTKQSEYNKPTQYQVRSILISYKDAQRAQGAALTRSKSEAQSLIESLLLKIQSGADFKALAVKTNDDLRALKNGGDLGYVDNTSIDTVSYDALSKLSSNKPLSDVVDTSYGFRIFKLENKKDGYIKSFESVKRELAQDLIKQKLQVTLQSDFENKIRASITHAENAESLDSLLAAENITWKSINAPFTIKSTFLPDLGSSDTLVENIFSLKNKGDILPVIIEFEPTTRAVFQLSSLKKPQDPSEADIKTLQKTESERTSKTFLQAYLQKLKESYESKGKIKVNPVIVQ